MGKLKKKISKKETLLRLAVRYNNEIPLNVAANYMYGSSNEISKAKVIRLLAAYRAARDTQCSRFRVKKGYIRPV